MTWTSQGHTLLRVDITSPEPEAVEPGLNPKVLYPKTGAESKQLGSKASPMGCKDEDVHGHCQDLSLGSGRGAFPLGWGAPGTTSSSAQACHTLSDPERTVPGELPKKAMSCQAGLPGLIPAHAQNRGRKGFSPVDSPPRPFHLDHPCRISVRPPHHTPNKTQDLWVDTPSLYSNVTSTLSCHIAGEDTPPCQHHRPVLLEHLEPRAPTLPVKHRRRAARAGIRASGSILGRVPPGTGTPGQHCSQATLPPGHTDFHSTCQSKRMLALTPGRAELPSLPPPRTIHSSWEGLKLVIGANLRPHHGQA